MLCRVRCFSGLLLALDIVVNGDGARLAGAHGQDDGGRAGDGVAAGEDALAGRHAALVGLNAALAGEGETAGGVADEGVGAGADGDDDGVHVQDPLAALHGDGRTAALLVGLAQLLALQLDAGDKAVLAREDAGRVIEQIELDALGLGMLDLFKTGGQLVAAAAVADVDMLRAETLGNTGGVHGDVARADDGDTVEMLDRGIVIGTGAGPRRSR